MKETLTFLKKLIKNNYTPWMHAHKGEYLAAKKEFEFLVQELIFRLREWDKKIPDLELKDCVFRINRDTRFSDNKKPYKENFACFISYGGKKSNLPGYYFHLSPKEIFLAGGVWMPEPEDLARIRRHIAEHGDQLKAILSQRGFKKTFGGLWEDQVLKRPPKGYTQDHPYIEFLKHKSFVVSALLTQAEVLKPNLGKNLETKFKEIKLLNEFLAEAL